MPVMTANRTWRRSDPSTDAPFIDRLALIFSGVAPSALLLSGVASSISVFILRMLRPTVPGRSLNPRELASRNP